MENLDCFKENLKELMEINNYTVKDISLKTGIKTSTIYSYLNDKHIPDLTRAIKIAQVFDCSLDFLFGFTEDFTPKKYKLASTANDRFKKVLADRKITRYRVHILTKISQNQLCNWFQDKQSPTLISLVTVAKALDCSLDYLAGRDEI